MAQHQDESLIDEMRATIRAERERAAARSGKALDPPAPTPAPAAAEAPVASAAPPAPDKGLLRRFRRRP
jgi:hypothetical protein